MNKKIFIITIAVLIIAGLGIWFFVFSEQRTTSNEQQLWACPMHPDYISDKPGDCPICGMSLVPLEQEQEPITDNHKHITNNKEQSSSLKHETRNLELKSKAALWTCPMHPDYISDKPGDCPICGMSLVPLDQEQELKTQNSKHKIQDHTNITINNNIQQLIGVTTDKVLHRELVLDINTYGTVAFDPKLYTAIDEYIETLKASKKLSNSEFAEVKSNSQDMVRRSKIKLKLMGLSDAQINKIGTGSVSPENLLFGKDKVWIYAEVYEYESGLIKKGQDIQVTTKAFPGHVFTGKIISNDPVLSGMTRTLRIRAEVNNTENLLKPEMFVNVNIKIPVYEKLTIPVEAVINTGSKDVVFREVSEGNFEPVEVTLGRSNDKYYEVLAGLNHGDTVVSSGNFLLDSESRIKATIKQKVESRKGKSSEEIIDPHSGH